MGHFQIEIGRRSHRAGPQARVHEVKQGIGPLLEASVQIVPELTEGVSESTSDVVAPAAIPIGWLPASQPTMSGGVKSQHLRAAGSQEQPMTIERLAGVRYVVPLREGGSLPAVVETDRRRAYVVKFRGAGQGAKALIAELLAARAGPALGLPVPAAGHRRPRRRLRQSRAGPGDPGHPARQRRRQLRARLPARRARLRSRRRARRRARPGRRRSSGSTPSSPTSTAPRATRTCCVWQRAALADRPRRRAVLPPPLAGLGGARPVAVPADRGPRAAARSPATWPPPTPGCARC